MGILNIEEYKRRLKSGNPVTIEELENEYNVLRKKN
jgi:putative transposase